MKRTLRIVMCAMLVGMMLLSACGNSSVGSSGGTKIYLTMYNEAKPGSFRGTLVEAAQAKAKAEGASIEVGFAEDSIEKQVEQVKSAVQQDYDVIICGPVSADTAVELEAIAGDIPIIFICNCPADKRLTANKYIYVGSDENVAGQFQAEYVLEKLGSKSELNVMIIKGPRGQSATDGRTKGAKRVFDKSGKQINYVFEDYADWDKGKAKDMFEIFLSTGNALDCILCNNDTMAMGIVEYCKENGVNLNNVPIMGVNAAGDACEAIKNGDMALTVYQSGVGQGEAAVEAALKLANGDNVKDIEGATEDGKYIWVPFERVDSSNVDQYIIE
ncbi:inositol transport system substrate-binding protein [Pseudobutyrivibrio sp. UC1225]|uniref:substrate-binding domain-containing protein n=1 Tax=Pseudobutyrivibrio sp. UC1225 TaxID=1798185 RepID=UPI0008EC47C7|nr:substrate-binding domain-containing protein [Pseudobutyrivibrio sp. UC1225]SFO20708.1 inositol transport system substrate-binding protein [Pseudobutyrivibrio sp. UC1225]